MRSWQPRRRRGWASRAGGVRHPAGPERAIGTRGRGRPLEDGVRREMEHHLGHDFGSVRVHDGAGAAVAARGLGASAYTLGEEIVFGRGRYAPSTSPGRRLLAHELAHVVQQRGGSRGPAVTGVGVDGLEREAEGVASSADSASRPLTAGAPALSAAPAGAVQRDDDEGLDEAAMRRFMRLGRDPMYQLRLDPEVEAQMRAFQITHQLLAPDLLRQALLNLDYDTIFDPPPPAWLTGPPTPRPAPLVPAGAGPATPRAGRPGDVVSAILRVPAVDAALTTLREDAASRARREWNSLTTGERALVVSHTAVIGAGALAGIASSAEAREFTLGLIQNRSIPVPGVPGLTFQFNLTGPDQRVRFDLNVGALLPAAWGFR
jgi:hypothetical protein